MSLSKKLEFKSSLCIIPPKEQCKQIQTIRSLHDPAYDRWMPHINFLYPFVPDSEFKFSSELIKNGLDIEPFKIKLEPFGYFKQKKQMWTMFMKIENDESLK